MVAQERRFFARHGLKVELSRHAAWAGLRDRMAFGQLEGAQMLAPMPAALALGVGGPQRNVCIAATLSRNGNTIVLSRDLMTDVSDQERPLAAVALAATLAKRRAAGNKPPVFAVVFAFSSHNYLLRYWLASGGIDPERDVRLVVVPPSQVVEQLANGSIDGFCSGEPWGSMAVEKGVGHIALTSADIWADHPEKVLAFADGNDGPAIVAATAAVIEAGQWADEPGNREETVRLLARDAVPDVPLSVIARVLDGGLAFDPGGPVLPTARMIFSDGMASYPSARQGEWYFAQMQRWGHVPDTATFERSLWRPDLWEQVAKRLGISPPPTDTFPTGPAFAPGTVPTP